MNLPNGFEQVEDAAAIEGIPVFNRLVGRRKIDDKHEDLCYISSDHKSFIIYHMARDISENNPGHGKFIAEGATFVKREE